MKVRNGFVSNSSSSSFIIGCKGKLTKEKLLSAMGVTEKNSIMYPFAEKAAEYIVNSSTEMTKKEYLDDMYLDEADLEGDALEIFNSGMTFYSGSASNDGGDGIENALCEMEIDYTSPSLIIKKEGGY